jgi:hypothetical protein
MKHGGKKIFIGLACLLSLTLMVGSALAANLVVNGGFESGNTGFGSDYGYQPPNDIHNQGVYVVGSNPNTYHSSWASFGAEEGTQMMIVNGANLASDRVWYENGINVVAGTTYYFSAWVASSYPVSPAQLDFSINNSPIGSLTASTTTGLWQLFYATWNSGANTTADLALVNQNTAFSGNDFCLDNIEMDTIVPTPLPPGVLLLGSSLAGLGLLRFRKKA